MGTLCLAGGAEFTGEMASLDRRLIEISGGPGAATTIIPAAAAPDNNHVRAGANGVRWFRRLGSEKVSALPLIDRASADDPLVERALRSSNLVYLLGGFPGHLATALSGSRGWNAVLAAHEAGAVVAGSSAGAMVLCEHFFDPYDNRIARGLDLVPNACVLPHHDTFGKKWAPRLRRLMPRSILIGVDEQTGLLGEPPAGPWRVYGGGSVVIYREGRMKRYRSGDAFLME